MLTVSEAWRRAWAGAHVGILVLRGVQNPPAHTELDLQKQALEAELRARFAGQDRKALEAYGPMPVYRAYYKLFKKTYHVLHQLESIALKGRSLPSVAALVEAMFMAEVKNLLLTAGHDLDQVRLPLTLDVATGDERYTLMRGEEHAPLRGDMLIADQAGILSSIIYGPDQRTQIRPETRRALFTVYCPAGIEPAVTLAHLDDIGAYARVVAPEAEVEVCECIGGEEVIGN